MLFEFRILDFVWRVYNASTSLLDSDTRGRLVVLTNVKYLPSTTSIGATKNPTDTPIPYTTGVGF